MARDAIYAGTNTSLIPLIWFIQCLVYANVRGLVMANVWFLCGCLVAALVPPSSVQLDSLERYLYAQLEDALVNDAATLEQLREVFFQEPPRFRPTKIHFHIEITADSILASNCSECSPWDTCEPAFYPVNRTTSNIITSAAQWKLCSHMNVKWRAPHYVDAVDFIKELTVIVVPWCTHGLSVVVLIFTGGGISLTEPGFYGGHPHDVAEPIRLSVKRLHCHPRLLQLTGPVGQLFSWIEVYTKSGGKPQSWNPQQQAVVTVHVQKYDFDSGWCGAYWLIDVNFDWNDNLKRLHTCALVGCFLLTLSLTMLIPRLFLRYHSKLIHNETSPGSRSLYWGTAIVSLFIAFSLMLGKLVLYPYFLFLAFESPSSPYFKYIVSNLVLEVFIPIVFFVVSVIASKNSRAVPMPAAKFTTHVLFCFCFCFCCSSRHKSKGVQVLILWAFMTFIYYHITEAIALVFISFLSISMTVSFALMYVSVVFFSVMLVSIILLSCESTGSSPSISVRFMGVVDVCATLLSFSFVILVFVAFSLMFPLFLDLQMTHEQVTGFESVSLKFSVLPSIALSVAGWFIKKKLLKEDSHEVQHNFLTDHGATDHEGERVVEGPEEERHILA